MTETVTLIGGPAHGERRVIRGGNVIRVVEKLPLPIRVTARAENMSRDIHTHDYVRSQINRDLFLCQSAGERTDTHFCKWCGTTFATAAPKSYTGDAVIECPECHHGHYRQFERGIATGCNPPSTGRPKRMKALVVIAREPHLAHSPRYAAWAGVSTW